jgi:hypothetical protein
MRNLLRPVPGLGPSPAGRVPSFRKVKEIKGLRGGVLKYGAQEIPQIDKEIAEKGHLWKLIGKQSVHHGTRQQGGLFQKTTQEDTETGKRISRSEQQVVASSPL